MKDAVQKAYPLSEAGDIILYLQLVQVGINTQVLKFGEMSLLEAVMSTLMIVNT